MSLCGLGAFAASAGDRGSRLLKSRSSPEITMTAARVLAFVLTASTIASAQQMRFDDVVRNLRNPDPRTRLTAVRLLRDAKYPEAIAPMAPLVVDPLDDVQL